MNAPTRTEAANLMAFLEAEHLGAEDVFVYRARRGSPLKVDYFDPHSGVERDVDGYNARFDLTNNIDDVRTAR